MFISKEHWDEALAWYESHQKDGHYLTDIPLEHLAYEVQRVIIIIADGDARIKARRVLLDEQPEPVTDYEQES